MKVMKSKMTLKAALLALAVGFANATLQIVPGATWTAVSFAPLPVARAQDLIAVLS